MGREALQEWPWRRTRTIGEGGDTGVAAGDGTRAIGQGDVTGVAAGEGTRAIGEGFSAGVVAREEPGQSGRKVQEWLRVWPKGKEPGRAEERAVLK